MSLYSNKSCKSFQILGFLLSIGLAGCTNASQKSNDQDSSGSLAALNNTQNNLKVAEIPATATTGQGYQYCYGCVAFNYNQFGSFSSTGTTSTQLLSAIEVQVAASSDNAGSFQTSVEYVPQDANAPAVFAQKSSVNFSQSGN